CARSARASGRAARCTLPCERGRFLRRWPRARGRRPRERLTRPHERRLRAPRRAARAARGGRPAARAPRSAGRQGGARVGAAAARFEPPFRGDFRGPFSEGRRSFRRLRGEVAARSRRMIASFTAQRRWGTVRNKIIAVNAIIVVIVGLLAFVIVKSAL